MKTHITIMGSMILAVFAVLSSGVLSQSVYALGTNGLEDRNIDVSGFHAIDVSSGFDVVLVQGNSEGLTLTAQENFFEHITAKVEQGVLKIYTDRNMNESKGLKARITFKSIDNLKVSGGGDISCETTIDVPDINISLSGGGDMITNLNTDDLKCHISGGGDATIGGKIGNYKLEMSGGGDLKSNVAAGYITCALSGGGDLTFKGNGKSTDANVSISGGGDIELDIHAEKLQCSISGGGDARLTGTADDFKIDLNGGGDIIAGSLITTKTVFRVSGGSDIHLSASKELTGYISGGGNVYYSGSPEIINIDAKGSSKIYKE
jgi:hypothetical protein